MKSKIREMTGLACLEEVRGHGMMYPAAIGVEIEIEREELDLKKGCGWKGVHDGSLREGIEYIFDGPKTGDEVHQLLAEYTKVSHHLNDSHMNCRTSIHIHVNVREMTAPEVRLMVLAYVTMERVLFSYIDSPFRNNNIYCVRLQEMSVWLSNFGRRITYNRLDGLLTDKYTALNTGRLMDLGTVEFRLFPTVNDGDKIMEWINLCLCLREFGKTGGIKKLEEIPYMVSCGSMKEAIGVVFKGMEDVLLPFTKYNDVLEGVRILQETLLSNTNPKSLLRNAKKFICNRDTYSILEGFKGAVRDDVEREEEKAWQKERDFKGMRVVMDEDFLVQPVIVDNLRGEE